PAPRPPLFPYTTLFRSAEKPRGAGVMGRERGTRLYRHGKASRECAQDHLALRLSLHHDRDERRGHYRATIGPRDPPRLSPARRKDRKSTRLNSSHVKIS